MSHNQGVKEVSRSKIEPNHSEQLGGQIVRLDQGEFIEVKGVALNQVHRPESSLRWRDADLFFTGAGEL